MEEGTGTEEAETTEAGEEMIEIDPVTGKEETPETIVITETEMTAVTITGMITINIREMEEVTGIDPSESVIISEWIMRLCCVCEM